MKIGIDVSFLAIDTRGMGRANRNIIERLFESKNHEFYPVMVTHRSDEVRVRKILQQKEANFLSLHDCVEGKLDLFWFPWSRIDFFPPCCRVITIHDLVPYRFSNPVSTMNGHRDRNRLKQACEAADHIITPSEFSKSEITTFLDIKAERITAIHHGVEEAFKPTTGEGDEDFLRYFSNGFPYILFVGSIEKRKNLTVLLSAFERLKQTYNIPHKLIIAGKFNPATAEKSSSGFANALRRAGFLRKKKQDAVAALWKKMKFRDDVLWRGEISEKELLKLYSLTDLFVFPSSYEGFGLPLLEAFASGVPVLAADIPVFREIGCEAAEYFLCKDSGDLARQIFRILSEPKLQAKMRRAGFERVKDFTWQRSAKLHIDAFKRSLTLNTSVK